MILYRKATLEDLERIWNHHIAENPDDIRYIRWKEAFLSRNIQKKAATFVVLDDDEPVGEVTLDYWASGYSGNRSVLADGKRRAYVTALRIRREYEGQGYISKLMGIMEEFAAAQGYSQLTIGVEVAQKRNQEIYLHWGYNKFLMSEIDDGTLVHFYSKFLPL